MLWLYGIAYAAFCAGIWRYRGSDLRRKHPIIGEKGVLYSLIGLGAGGLALVQGAALWASAATFVWVSLMIWCFAAPGVGLLFRAITGLPVGSEVEIPILDKIASKFYDKNGNEDDVRSWATVWGTMRGMFIFPLFAGLAFLYAWWAALFGLPGMAMGLIYRLSGVVWRERSVELAEVLVGFFIVGVPIGVVILA